MIATTTTDCASERDRDLIARIIAQHPVDAPLTALADYLADELAAIRAIASGVECIARDEYAERARHEDVLTKIEERRHGLRERCRHWRTTTQVDPCGHGRDTVCDDCGKELER